MAFEVDPNADGGDNFSTLVYHPVAAVPGWSQQDAILRCALVLHRQ